MKRIFIALGLFILYSCTSTVYHHNAKRMIIQIPNQKKEKIENKINRDKVICTGKGDHV